MSDALGLQPLEGTNPIGFLAALGVLSALERWGRSPTLLWTDALVPSAVFTGADDIEDLIDVVDGDRRWWANESVTLGWHTLPDVKVDSADLHDWASAVRDGWLSDPANPCRRDDVGLWSALVAEGALAEKGDAKPSHLHFTAGQQRFLVVARSLARDLDRSRLEEVLRGPWRYDSDLKGFGWDLTVERVYALRANDPSGETRLGVPGADWLAMLGLKFFPVAIPAGGRTARRLSLRTTACDDLWKGGAFRWPLWSRPATARAVQAMLEDVSTIGDRTPRPGGQPQKGRRRANARELSDRGLSRILESPIRRAEQGGYGSFGAPRVLVDVMPEHR